MILITFIINFLYVILNADIVMLHAHIVYVACLQTLNFCHLYGPIYAHILQTCMFHVYWVSVNTKFTPRQQVQNLQHESCFLFLVQILMFTNSEFLPFIWTNICSYLANVHVSCLLGECKYKIYTKTTSTKFTT